MRTRRVFSIGLVITVICLGLGADFIRAEDSLWTSDFAAAKAKAKAKKKSLLVDFTGSDWCVWCKRLHAEVFDKDLFQTEAPKQFVLVELDYPHAKKLPDEVQAQNEKLAKDYKIRGFPTVLMLDAEGQVIAHTGYQAGGPEKYMARLGDFSKTYAGVLEIKKALGKAQGLDRAKLLDQLVTAYDKLNNPVDDLMVWSKEIVALDADNKAGLKINYQVRIVLAEAEQLALERKLAEAIAVLGKGLEISGISGEQKQDFYLMHDSCGLNRKELPARVGFLKTALAAAPESGNAPRIKAMIKPMEAAIEAQEFIAKNMDAAEKAAGLEKAKLLDQLVEATDKLLMFGGGKVPAEKIAAWRKEIPELDSDNKAGLKSKYEFDNLIREATTSASRGEFDDLQTTLDKALALPGITAVQTQQGLTLKGNFYLNVNDFEKATEFLKKALEAAPEGRWIPLDKMMLERAAKKEKTDPGKKAN